MGRGGLKIAWRHIWTVPCESKTVECCGWNIFVEVFECFHGLFCFVFLILFFFYLTDLFIDQAKDILREKSQAIKMSDPQLKKLKIQTGKNLLTKLILIKFSMKLPTPGYFPIYRFQLNIVLFCLFFWHKSWNYLSTDSR